MKINISSLHFKTDKKLDDFIKEKVEKLSTFYDGIISADITLKAENSENIENKLVDIRLAIKGNDLFAKKESASFEDAIDDVVEALRKQLIKHKEKVKGI